MLLMDHLSDQDSGDHTQHQGNKSEIFFWYESFMALKRFYEELKRPERSSEERSADRAPKGPESRLSHVG